MFDLGLTELLLIGIVALIIVGPKDLPVLFRRVGEFVGRMKGMAREFTSAMNDAADETGVKDVAKTMRAATNPIKTELDKVGETSRGFTNFDPLSETGKLASKRQDASKKIREATAKRRNDKKVSTENSKAEKSKKNTPKKKIKSCLEETLFLWVLMLSYETLWLMFQQQQNQNLEKSTGKKISKLTIG